MNPWLLIAARSSGSDGPRIKNRMPDTARAQLHRFVQIRHPEKLGLFAQSLRDLDHAMAVAIRLHNREQRGPGSDPFPREAGVVAQSGAIYFRPTAF